MAPLILPRQKNWSQEDPRNSFFFPWQDTTGGCKQYRTLQVVFRDVPKSTPLTNNSLDAVLGPLLGDPDCEVSPLTLTNSQNMYHWTVVGQQHWSGKWEEPQPTSQMHHWMYTPYKNMGLPVCLPKHRIGTGCSCCDPVLPIAQRVCSETTDPLIPGTDVLASTPGNTCARGFGHSCFPGWWIMCVYSYNVT